MYQGLVKFEGFTKTDNSVEDYLEELSKYGYPRISKLSTSSAWHATVEVFVTGEGISFDVASDFNHPTPRDALALCYERLLKSIKAISGTK